MNMVSTSPKASTRGAMQLAQKPVNVVSTSPKASALSVMQLVVSTGTQTSERGVILISPNSSERCVN